MSRPVLALLIAVAAAGCAGTFSKSDELTIMVREYNDGVRWGRLDQSVIHVPPEERKRFMARHAGLEDQLQILDLDMTRVDIDRSKESAEVLLDVSWMLKDRGVVEKTVVAQSWAHRDGQWILTREVRLRGATLTLFDELPKPKTDAAEGAAPTVAGAPGQTPPPRAQ
jgi:hypothetical protein